LSKKHLYKATKGAAGGSPFSSAGRAAACSHVLNSQFTSAWTFLMQVGVFWIAWDISAGIFSEVISKMLAG